MSHFTVFLLSSIEDETPLRRTGLAWFALLKIEATMAAEHEEAHEAGSDDGPCNHNHVVIKALLQLVDACIRGRWTFSNILACKESGRSAKAWAAVILLEGFHQVYDIFINRETITFAKFLDPEAFALRIALGELNLLSIKIVCLTASEGRGCCCTV